MKSKLCALLLSGLIVASIPAFAQSKSASPPPGKTTVAGKVVDNKGKPIPKAKVMILSYGQRGQNTKVVYTDKQGKYKCILDTPNYQISAVAERFSYGEQQYSQNQNDRNNITLWPEYVFKSKIVDEAGKPLQGIKVTVNQCYAYNYSSGTMERAGFYNSTELCNTVTSEDGSFTLRHLVAPGDFEQYTLGIRISGKGRASINKSFSQRELSAAAKIVDPVECYIEGTLNLPGNTGPAPEQTGLMIQLDNKWTNERRHASTDKNGHFSLSGLPPGNHQIMLESPHSRWDPSSQKEIPATPHLWALPVAAVEVKPSQTATINLSLVNGALIEGAVKSKSADNPLKNARLVVEHDGVFKESGYYESEIGEDGKFAYRVVPGKVSIKAQVVNNYWMQDGATPTISLDVVDGQVKSDVVLLVDPSNSMGPMNNPIPADFELTSGTYDLKWDADIDCSSSMSTRCFKSGADAKRMIKKLPKVVSAKPTLWVYPVDALDNGMTAVILDESKGSGKGYDTVYFDTNRNWDFSDEKPMTFGPLKENRYSYSDWVSIASNKGNGSFQIKLEAYQTSDGAQGYLTMKGGLKGVVASNKGQIECALIDSNINGAYNDLFGKSVKLQNGESTTTGDTIYFDSNGAGKVYPAGYGTQAVMLQNVCQVGQKFYNIEASATGDKITIKPYTGQTGTLQVKATDICGMSGVASSYSLSGSVGSYSTGDSETKSISVPVGDYKISMCNLVLDSGESGKIALGCQLSSTAHIKAGEAASIEISGKPSVALCPTEKKLSWTRGNSTAIEWAIKIGNDVTLTSLGDRSAKYAPTVKFFNKSGKLLHTTKAGFT